MILALLQAMRPHQWVKNLLVLAPLVFAHKIGEGDAVGRAGLAFGLFCLLSSAVYLLNDVVDRQADAAHPRKQVRPIASGRLGVRLALSASALLGLAAMTCAWFLSDFSRSLPFVVWPGAYLALQLAYTFYLKRQLIVDCLCIALGFLFRVHAGSVVLAVESSSWILLCTFFFALFLAFGKRREEVVKVSDGTGRTRATMRGYSLAYLDQVIPSLAALSILSYALYTLAERTQSTHHSRNLVITVPIVVYGVFRYQYLVCQRGEGGDPSRLLFRDPSLIGSGVVYLATVWLALNSGPLLGSGA